MKILTAVASQLLKWKLQDWLLLAALIVAVLCSLHIVDPAQLAGVAALALTVYKLFRQFALLAEAAKTEPLGTPEGTPPAPPQVP
jgi:hypothetical protein